jgi:hypothetical protein
LFPHRGEQPWITGAGTGNSWRLLGSFLIASLFFVGCIIAKPNRPENCPEQGYRGKRMLHRRGLGFVEKGSE